MLVIMHLVYLPRLENSYENIKFYPISLCARFSFTLRSDPLTMGHNFPDWVEDVLHHSNAFSLFLSAADVEKKIF